jgi:hypothetical protein
MWEEAVAAVQVAAADDRERALTSVPWVEVEASLAETSTSIAEVRLQMW